MMPKFKLCLGFLLGAMGFMSAQAGANNWAVNMPRGVTEISREIYDLHMLIIWICVGIGVVVYGILLWSLFAYRKSKGAKPASFHESTTVEIIWTVIPIIILVSMAIPATRVMTKIYDTSDAELDILVTAYQWRWQYTYLDDELNSNEEVSFFSSLTTSDDEIFGRDHRSENYLLEVDEPMVVPVNTKVRLLITAADVIHAWWIPEFAVKKDAIPGFINESWFIAEEPGIYRGQCAELCGRDHGFMPIVVEVLEREEYDAWYADRQAQAAAIAELATQEWSMEDLMAQGQTVYRTFCAACHQPNGQGLPPAFPALAGSPVSTGPMADNIALIWNGVPGTAMAAYGNNLNPIDFAAVITYQRNAFGNNVGDMVTPVEILQMQSELE